MTGDSRYDLTGPQLTEQVINLDIFREEQTLPCVPLTLMRSCPSHPEGCDEGPFTAQILYTNRTS